MSTLVKYLEKAVATAEDQPALIFGETTVSYRSLYEACVRLANGMSRLGIERGDRVAIILPNVPHFPISYYATLMLGAIAVPINFMHDTAEIEHQLTDSSSKALIIWQNFVPRALPAFDKAASCENLIVLGELIPSFAHSLTTLIAESEPHINNIEISPSDVAVINYTSGITDVAMGAELTHEGLEFNATTFVEMLRVSSNDRLIAVLPLFHPLGQSIVMNAAFTARASMVLAIRFRANEVARIVQKNNVTIMPAVPGMFRAFNELDEDEYAMPSLKYCMSYGGLLPPAILEEFERKFGTLILKSYGLTEAGPLVTSTRTSHERMRESSGLPLMGVEVQIRDKEGNILRPNHSGEVYVKSPSIMKGYHNQPEETNRRLQDGWLATGDIGYIDINHYLYIQERKDDVIIKGGFEIHSIEVERVLLDHPGVDEAAVVAVPDPVQGSEVKAFMVMKEGYSFTDKQILEHCQNLLPNYKCPKYFERVEKLPKSPTGRILKRTLRQASQPRSAVNSKYSQ
ncbi:MAG: hypothetical protein D6814_11345 [Calditrichaeota bacterium]|nr:MAG: hypothetical protein D6814_11345 [Calditrichota bacterium]